MLDAAGAVLTDADVVAEAADDTDETEEAEEVVEGAAVVVVVGAALGCSRWAA